MDELNQLRQILKPNWRIFDPRLPPSSIATSNWKPTMNIRPDVIISDLSQSVILEVKAAELLLTDQYPTKCTLRFPRVVRIRYSDSKLWNEAMTKEDLDKMVLDFNETRRLPGKRILDDVYQSEESQNFSDEEKKIGKKKTRQSGVSDSFIQNMLK